MFRAGFEFLRVKMKFVIKINELVYFCGAGTPSKRLKSKTNEIANVCGLKNSFCFVM